MGQPSPTYIPSEKGCKSIWIYLHSKNWKEDSVSCWCLSTWWWSCLGAIRIPIRIVGACRWGWRGRLPTTSTFSSDPFHYFFSHCRDHRDNSVDNALKNMSFYLTSPWGKACWFLILGIGGIRLHSIKVDDV